MLKIDHAKLTHNQNNYGNLQIPQINFKHCAALIIIA